MQTLAKGLELGKAQGKLVLACSTEGAFAEALVVDATLDGARLYGGFGCDDWGYSASSRTAVLSPSAVALRVDDLSEGLTFEDMTFEAADAGDPGESSLGAFITRADGVRLVRVSLTAGRGAHGDDGAGIVAAAATGATGSNGTAACVLPTQPNAGGAAVESRCGGAATGSVGGKGGDGGNDGSSAGSGNEGEPAENGGLTGIGEVGAAWSCNVGPGLGGATAGNNSPSATSGLGAAGTGTITLAGYDGADGADGNDGLPGQGGGGAKAPATCVTNPRTGASGGGGGGGGCGGKGGYGGGGLGGPSLGIAFSGTAPVESSVDVTVASGPAPGGSDGAGMTSGSGAGADGLVARVGEF